MQHESTKACKAGNEGLQSVSLMSGVVMLQSQAGQCGFCPRHLCLSTWMLLPNHPEVLVIPDALQDFRYGSLHPCCSSCDVHPHSWNSKTSCFAKPFLLQKSVRSLCSIALVPWAAVQTSNTSTHTSQPKLDVHVQAT